MTAAWRAAPQLQEFARRHALKIGTIADLIRHRLRNERTVERISEQTVQTEFGEFRLYAYQDEVQPGRAPGAGARHASTAPARRWCACTWPTRCATCSACTALRAPGRCARRMQRIVEAGNGVVVMLRQQEVAARARRSAARLGCDRPATAATGRKLPRAQGAVLRTFGVGAQILKDLGVRRMRVLSAPKQMHGISAFGLEVEGYVGEEG